MTIATEELRKLVNDATPGPWEARSSRQGCWVSADCDPWTVVGTEDDEGRYGAIKIDANAVLIAMTPTIAAELITARAKLEAAAKMAEAIMGMDDGWRGISDKARAALAAWEAAK